MALLTLIELHNNEHVTIFRVGTQIVDVYSIMCCMYKDLSP